MDVGEAGPERPRRAHARCAAWAEKGTLPDTPFPLS